MEGFEGFCEFPGNADGSVGGQVGKDFEGGWKAVGGFKKEGGFSGIESGLKLLATFALLDMEEAVKGKRMGREAGGDQGRGDGGWAGENGEFDFLITAGFEEAMPRIGEAGGAGVGDDGDLFSLAGSFDELGDPLLFVVVVQRDQWAGNLEMIEEPEGVPRVLAGDEVGSPQGVDGPQSDVPQVAYWCRNKGDEGIAWLWFRCHRQGGR